MGGLNDATIIYLRVTLTTLVRLDLAKDSKFERRGASTTLLVMYRSFVVGQVNYFEYFFVR
jgi:hypothetical protein